MNARKTLAVFAITTLLAAQAALAAPVGTAKSLGDYRPFWQSQFGSTARAHRTYAHRTYATQAPMVMAPAAVMAAPAPAPAAVAQAPTAGRRFSYEPSSATGAAATAATAPVTATAPIVQGHAYRPAHSTARHATVNRWSLPKTDARKYTTN